MAEPEKDFEACAISKHPKPSNIFHPSDKEAYMTIREIIENMKVSAPPFFLGSASRGDG